MNVLDPVADEFGDRLSLTYGFASPALTRLIGRGIAPELDQHAGGELNRNGDYICPRLGAAVDLFVEGLSATDLVRRLVVLPFDRLYIYGDDRPVHVSVGPDASRMIVAVVQGKRGRRPGRRWSAEQWLFAHAIKNN